VYFKKNVPGVKVVRPTNVARASNMVAFGSRKHFINRGFSRSKLSWKHFACFLEEVEAQKSNYFLIIGWNRLSTQGEILLLCIMTTQC